MPYNNRALEKVLVIKGNCDRLNRTKKNRRQMKFGKRKKYKKEKSSEDKEKYE